MNRGASDSGRPSGNFYYPDLTLDQLIVTSVDENYK